jgi:protein SCO1/2
MRTLVLALFALSVAALVCAQTPARNGHELHGKVTEVNAGTKSLTVDHEAVPGWMDAMTMTYAVDKESVLKNIKPGDHIAATVYDGDLVLHKVRVVKPSAMKR